ncbi:MAG TPA: hypothetical protein PK529_06190, partial [Verrucomicrobiales bacterium]|nr:hypothetical protein [Verrucomicrobiales bacterium]
MGARAFFVASLVVGLSAVLCIAAPAGNQVPPQELVQQFLGDYCMECHDADVQKGERTFEKFALPLQSEMNVIEAKAHFDAPERQVHIRVGGLDGRLYLDLGDETWRAVEIDATGWRVIDNPPVRFRRASGMKPMPIPMGGGSI